VSAAAAGSGLAGRRLVPAIAAAVTLAVHLAGNPHYGFFRDELYFIICGFRPDFGYVDQPPVVPLLAAGTQLLGHSLFLLRAVPALFAAGGAYVTCLLAAEMGGGIFAQALAAFAYLFTGVLMSFGTKVGPDEVGLWLWPLIGLYVLRIANGADPRWWLAVGTLLGICLESKYSVIFFALAVLGGLALTPQRRILRTRWFAAGIGIAALLALPNFAWQAAHGFPMWELLRAGQTWKNTHPSPGLYLFQELLITSLTAAVVWIAGLFWTFLRPPLRFLGWAYVLLIAQMIVLQGKHYYPADVYPILIAAGGVAFERWTAAFVPARALVVAVVATGGFLIPFSLPVLGEEQMVAYSARVTAALHLKRDALATEKQQQVRLPSDWADMHGWPELAATVAKVYDSLPPAQRAIAVIAASNYGEAAAIDFFGARYHLPPVISGHNNYWLWGTHGYSGDVLIDVNGDCGRSLHLYRSSRLAATYADPWGEAYEMGIPIMLCKGITAPLSQIWPQTKKYE